MEVRSIRSVEYTQYPPSLQALFRALSPPRPQHPATRPSPMQMMTGDWLQGPYVYALYVMYGFDRGQIGLLFIAGFGSSFLFGTVAGSLADRVGRKRMALVYCVTYAVGCLTKHSSDFYVLLFGRILAGIATSLLFSVFEAWVVGEHHRQNFDDSLLGDLFSRSTFWGNGVAAIVSGLVASFLVEFLSLGKVAPFDAAAVVLSLGFFLISSTWTENYGQSDSSVPITQMFASAWNAITSSTQVAALGVCQAVFEGAMYVFIFLWTPAIETPTDGNFVAAYVPHGLIFACFMAASMLGSGLSTHLMRQNDPSKYMMYVFLGAAVCLCAPTLTLVLGWTYPTLGRPGTGFLVDLGGVSLAGQLNLLAFVCYELLVGIFWPSMMKLRAKHVPDEVRATVINTFRMPVNLFVCLVLFKSGVLSVQVMFILCAAMNVVAAVALRWVAATSGPEYQRGNMSETDI